MTAHLAAVFVLIATVACNGQALVAPTTPTNAHVIDPQPAAWALSGQSNAVFVQPFLSAVAPALVGASHGSTPISAWAVDGTLWAQLEPTLHQPLAAFIWWQGESDESDLATYPATLGDLLTRVRAAAQRPDLLVVLCGANDDPVNAALIAVQQDYAATHSATVYVPSNDLPDLDGSQHLTDDGYRVMAQRIADAIHAGGLQ